MNGKNRKINSTVELKASCFLFRLCFQTIRPTSKSRIPISLQTVLLQNNKLEKFPVALCNIPSLKVIRLEGNPFLEDNSNSNTDNNSGTNTNAKISTSSITSCSSNSSSNICSDNDDVDSNETCSDTGSDDILKDKKVLNMFVSLV